MRKMPFVFPGSYLCVSVLFHWMFEKQKNERREWTSFKNVTSNTGELGNSEAIYPVSGISSVKTARMTDMLETLIIPLGFVMEENQCCKIWYRNYCFTLGSKEKWWGSSNAYMAFCLPHDAARPTSSSLLIVANPASSPCTWVGMLKCQNVRLGK